MEIRGYRASDEAAAYAVCLGTGDNGRDATGLFRDPDLLGHVYVGPYLRFAPEFASVLHDGDTIVGYVLGVADTAAFEAWCESEWWPSLRVRYPRDVPVSERDDELIRVIHSPYRMDPATAAAGFPAHLHIDLLPPGQGRGHGRAMMDRVLGQLTAAGAPGVHLFVGADNERAIGFYLALGFTRALDVPGAVLMTKPLR
ncbi:GNAT family N-acetyltransferase [Rugosimonospora africana]|uniref:N-acetyltransferase domain-containing protein n=1 Tax=Rugosimonospora africana TaxID=556532 RepID=A0A8J3QZX0_9ACTN|nr:GNAT family N-acetyltransferase [Rugosimonospora africana]GIH19666.1 hypothetical protein Raf01_78380 [Rugosimonospora africana]